MKLSTVVSTAVDYLTGGCIPRRPTSPSSSDQASRHPYPSAAVRTTTAQNHGQRAVSLLSLNKPLPAQPIQYYPPRADSLEHNDCQKYRSQQIYFSEIPAVPSCSSANYTQDYGRGHEDAELDEYSAGINEAEMGNVWKELPVIEGENEGQIEIGFQEEVEESLEKVKVAEAETEQETQVFFTAKSRVAVEMAS